jgi:hypothetical protein
MNNRTVCVRYSSFSMAIALFLVVATSVSINGIGSHSSRIVLAQQQPQTINKQKK